MHSRLLVRLISNDDDDELRTDFGRSLQCDHRQVVNRRIFLNGLIFPRTTIAGDDGFRHVAMSEYNYSDIADELRADKRSKELTIFVFNGNSHADIKHVRMVAFADYIVEVSGINPGGLRVVNNYIYASPGDLSAVWQIILSGKLNLQNKSADKTSGTIGSIPVVGHWG